MSIAEKLLTIAENEQRVYDAAKRAENKAFWDMVTNNNTRTAYTMAFYRWGCEYLHPPYKIYPASGVNHYSMFEYAQNLKAIEKSSFFCAKLCLSFRLTLFFNFRYNKNKKTNRKPQERKWKCKIIKKINGLNVY